MKLKLFIIFLFVFAAIGQTIFLNIDAKSIFLEEKSKNTTIYSLENDSEESSMQSSEVVVTIRQHESENSTEIMTSDTEENTTPLELKNKKPCTQKTEQERLICQKAKEAAKQKQSPISGSNHSKSSTIQNP